MGEETEPSPVKLFVGLITGRPEALLDEVKPILVDKFGEIDATSPLIPFDFTDYYRSTMGSDLKRKFLAFRELIDPGRLSRIKLETNEVEAAFAGDDRFRVSRPVNIDPGYIGLSKMVLATTKNYSHRVYLGDGIYAEVTLQYSDGSFAPQPWTYPDYRTEEYLEFFDGLRARYQEQLDG